MKNTALLVIAMLALVGCSSTEVIEPTEAMPEIAVEKDTTVIIEENVTNYIPIGTLLEKLIASGCVIDTLTYREIEAANKSGGHVQVKCITTTTDALDIDTDL